MGVFIILYLVPKVSWFYWKVWVRMYVRNRPSLLSKRGVFTPPLDLSLLRGILFTSICQVSKWSYFGVPETRLFKKVDFCSTSQIQTGQNNVAKNLQKPPKPSTFGKGHRPLLLKTNFSTLHHAQRLKWGVKTFANLGYRWFWGPKVDLEELYVRNVQNITFWGLKSRFEELFIRIDLEYHFLGSIYRKTCVCITFC